MYSCTILNMTGDITISWDNSTSNELKDWIQEKIDSGHTFFIVEKKCFGLINKKNEIKTKEDLTNKKGKITLTEEQEKQFLNKSSKNKITFSGEEKLEKMVATEIISAKRVKYVENSTKKIAKTASEVMSSNSLCVKPMMGG